MAQQAGMIFEHASELKLFTLGQNRRVEAWIARNWERAGMTGPIDKSYVSKALSSLPVLEPVVKALDMLFDEITSDPWAWCKPPERVEDMPEYAPLSWWYEVLKPPVPWTAFASMSGRPLKEAYREVTQTRLSEWSSRLRAACDQYKADHALVQALRADMNPEYQFFGGRRGRVGNPGLHGRSAEEIGLAVALSRAPLPLPLIEEARLAYDRPNARPVHDHISEPVEPWMGFEFEGVETEHWEDVVWRANRATYREVEHKVIYYWDGSRYQVEDVEGGEFVRVRDVETGRWRDTTERERELMITRIIRKHEPVEDLLARRDQWIADEWAEKKTSYSAMRDFPDGVPESEAVRAFESVLANRRANQEAMQEREDIARARANFKLWRGSRRRP